MFRITEDPSSGSLVQCLSKNYKNDSIMSVDMDKVGVMAAYSDSFCVCVCSSLYTQAFIYSDVNKIRYTKVGEGPTFEATPCVSSLTKD
jgi:hypothetical protein